MIKKLDRRIKQYTNVYINGNCCKIMYIYDCRTKFEIYPKTVGNVLYGLFPCRADQIERFTNEGLKSWLIRK